MDKGIKNIFQFWRHFLSPYMTALLPLVLLNMIPGVLLSLRPLVLSPVLGRVLPGNAEPATSLLDLSLDNIGATIQALVGDPNAEMASAFIMSGIMYLLLTSLSAGLGGAATIASMSVRLKILRDMTIALHSHLISLHLGYHIKQKSGDMISRFSIDLAKSAASMETVFSGLARSSMQLIIYVFILFYSAPLVTTQILLVGCLHLIITKLLGGRVKHYTRASYDTLAQQTATLQETFQNIRIIKSFSAERFNEAALYNNAEDVREMNYRHLFARYLEDPVRLFADGLVTVAILPIAYGAIQKGNMTLAGIALYFYIASQLIVPISEISRQALNVFGMQGGFARLVEIFGAKNQVIDGSETIASFSRGISLKNVTFSYDEVEILRGVNLDIKKGETIGIVGESGGGKTTLVDLILRLYDPIEGTVECDGISLKNVKQGPYRALFGIVSQECLLFNSSLADNIIFGREFSREKLIKACEVANLQDVVDELPEGLDTIVGDRGARLSGGQRQRVAIARAVYDSPQIIILDEATSALDTVSERQVQQAINKATKDITSVVIAHRLSTIRDADKIVVVQKGTVEAIGDHKTLLHTSETYQKLIAMQQTDD